MKKGITIFLIVLLIGSAIAGLFLIFQNKEDQASSIDEGGSGCIKVNRDKFTVQWLEDKIPGGTIGDIAKDIFGSSDPEFGNIVSGFYKAIDVYPSRSSGKYFKKDIQAYYNSPHGLPRWEVAQGELACD